MNTSSSHPRSPTTTPTHHHATRLFFFLLLLVCFAIHTTSAASSSSDKCAADGGATFHCPNCNDIQVSDCSSQCDGYLFGDSNHGICYDRKLFHVRGNVVGDPENHYPFLWIDIAAAIVWFLAAGVATACGVGGGGIYVPLGILLLRFPPKAASGLSQASIFGASLGGLIVNIRNRHPDEFIRETKGSPLEGHPGKIVPYEKDLTKAEIEVDRKRYLEGGDGKRKFYTRPVIDYDMALFLAPMEMAGAVLGVIVQRLFPDWLFLSFAALILAFTSYKTYVKFVTAFRKEKAKREESKLRESVAETKRTSVSVSVSSSVPVTVGTGSGSGEEESGGDDSANANANANDDDDDETQEEREEYDDPKQLELRRQFLKDDSRQYPKEKLAYLSLLWAGLTVITFLKGGKGVDSVIGITCEDAGYYVLLALQFVWTLGFGAFFGYKNTRKTQDRLAVQYPFNETDVLWDYQKLRFYSFFTFLAGIVAGLIGIGGGMVLGPLMIVMGVHPSVSTATTASMILLTSSSVAVIFVMSGLVPWEYALFFFLVCLCGAYIGKTRIDAYVKRTGMASILIGVLATIIALATVGCIVNLFLGLSAADWCLAGFNSFCLVKSHEDECDVRMLMETPEELFPF
ncbi:hypothetical protein ACHAXS_002373 [Conticribra weissflogii]